MDITMNGRTRLTNTITGNETDRMPVSPFIWHNFIREYANDADADVISAGIETYKSFGLDTILRTCTIGGTLDFTNEDCDNWRVKTHEENDGKVIVTTITTPDGRLCERKNVRKKTKYYDLEAVFEYFIKTSADFDIFLKHQPPVPAYDCTVINNARTLLGDDGLVAPWISGAFNTVGRLRNLQKVFTDPYEDEGFYRELIGYFLSRTVVFTKQLVDAGADIISGEGNMATGTMAGPGFFEEYVLPYEEKLVREVQRQGAFYLYHNCGDAKSLLPLYSGIGMDVYESLTAPPNGDTLLDEAFFYFAPEITLSGNIDQIDFLINATPEQVYNRTKTVVMAAKERGRFILATSDYIEEGTPHDNIRAMVSAVTDYGKR